MTDRRLIKGIKENAGRLVLGLAFAMSVPCSASAEMRVDVGAPGAEDDYLCWGRVSGGITFSAGDVLPPSVSLSYEPHESDTLVGEVGFSSVRGAGSDLTPTLDVTIDSLSRTGRFFVAGTIASTARKDVKIVATNSADGSRVEVPVMVRVRKNAESLTEEERDIFLESLADAAQRNNQFAKYWGIHTDAINMAHQVAFLPWHRVFLLNLEREIQAENPAVALHYWEFDKVAPNLFSVDFLGRVGGLANPLEVEFAASNPLRRFRLSDPRVTPLTREHNGDLTVSPKINKDFFSNDTYGVMRQDIWSAYHGHAHVHIGGLLSNMGRSPADPLFFMLHANVDRAWAAWQRHHDRFDQGQTSSYELQGAHSAGASYIKGNFVEDTMWPWNKDPGNQSVTITIGNIRLPTKSGAGAGAPSNPMVGEMIDYLDVMGDGVTHNYCYDTVPAGVGPVADFP